MNTWEVDGVVYTTAPQPKKGMNRKKFVVRYSSDKLGKSLSISDERSGVMFMIPVDEILKDIIEGGGS